MKHRSGVAISLVLALLLVGGTGLFAVTALRAPAEMQSLLVRLVVGGLTLFLAALFLRYFGLLWFAYLGHAERRLLDDAAEGGGVRATLPAVSVVVPVHDRAELLRGTLASLAGLDYPVFEVVVVDDGSTDETLEVAADWEGLHGGGDFRVVTKSHGGCASALNAGIAASKHAFVLCVDADTRLEPDALRRAIRHVDDPTVGSVLGNVKVENRNGLLTDLQALEYVAAFNLRRRAQGFLAAVSLGPSSMGLFRREALEAVGGYDTGPFSAEVDPTPKMVAIGWKVVHEDRAVAWTRVPERWLELVQERYRWTRGTLRALARNKHVLARPLSDPARWLTAIELGFETVVWPVLNVYAHLFFAIVALLFGAGELLLYWWILLTLLDLAAALVAASMEEESLTLVPLALVYRFSFALLLDVVRAFATLEELLDVEVRSAPLERLHST